MYSTTSGRELPSRAVAVPSPAPLHFCGFASVFVSTCNSTRQNERNATNNNDNHAYTPSDHGLNTRRAASRLTRLVYTNNTNTYRL